MVQTSHLNSYMTSGEEHNNMLIYLCILIDNYKPESHVLHTTH